MKILKWIIALPFIALALFVLARFALCRPNYFTVKTATPMVEKIADYIVANGVPESLDNIPDLPYKLEDCKRKIVYKKEIDLQNVQVKLKIEADWAIHEERCMFIHASDEYSVQFWFVENYKNTDSTHGDIDITSDKTSIGIGFKIINEKLIHDTVSESYNKISGFCRQFKQ